MTQKDFKAMTEAQKAEHMEKKKGIFMLSNPLMDSQEYNLRINVFKCEGLPSAGKKSDCNAFVAG
jgi:hypothetical protein